MNIKLLIGLILFAGSLSSCKKWLEVQPESEISAPVLFSTENGFMEALNGIYIKSTSHDLYGKELTFGTTEALAQNFSIGTDGQDYRQTSLYNYTNGKFIERKDKIWSGLYSAIVNCNLILSNIDERKNVFTGSNYELIKGETLALRAYLHFDLLRLFAPSYLKNPTAPGIPFAKKYTKEVTPMSSVTEVMTMLIQDLEQAKVLMANDPIRSAGYKVNYPLVTDTTKNTEENSPFLFLQNRRHHLNYYAVCGTLARIYLYKNDKVNALKNAKEVIDSKKFPWTSQSDFIAFDEAKKDRILYKELLFGWYIPNSTKDIKENWFKSGTRGFFLLEDDARLIYEAGTVGAEDLRFKQWVTLMADVNSRWYDIVKYNRNSLSTEANANLHYQMAPAIRLSEIYYIAAECSYATNPTQSLQYFNEVRAARGFQNQLTVPSEDGLINELLKEARKEWLAEGQMFYMYKRLNKAIAAPTGTAIPPSDKIFVLPLPNDEIVYGGR
ncbi:RagB/SusD family nutrient uptake outer membrane protein [Pedobacter steynii]